MAIVHRMADGEDWMPGTELQAICKELQEAREWLSATQKKKSTPLSPHMKTPTVQEPMNPPNSPRGESEIGNEGDKARDEANTGKVSSLPQSAGKRVSKVSEGDQMEHVLAGGQWEGLGAVRKGGEIHIEVHLRQ